MNVVNDYLDILQNIEFAIAAVYRARPELRDPDVIMALDKLIMQYTREKKNLPALPVALPEKSMAVFQAIQDICEFRITRNGAAEVTNEAGMTRLPLRLMILCLDRLLKSANTWHKRDGHRGYLGFVSQFV